MLHLPWKPVPPRMPKGRHRRVILDLSTQVSYTCTYILCNSHISQLGRHTGMRQDQTAWMQGLTSSHHFDVQWRHGSSPRAFPLSPETSTSSTTTTEYPQPLCKGKGKAWESCQTYPKNTRRTGASENEGNQWWSTSVSCFQTRPTFISRTCSAQYPDAGANISGVSGAAACFCLYGGRPAWLADIWCFCPCGCSQNGFMQKQSPDAAATQLPSIKESKSRNSGIPCNLCDNIWQAAVPIPSSVDDSHFHHVDSCGARTASYWEVLAALSLRRICLAVPRVALWRAFFGDDAVGDVLLQHQEGRFQALVVVVMLVFSFNKWFQAGSSTQYLPIVFSRWLQSMALGLLISGLRPWRGTPVTSWVSPWSASEISRSWRWIAPWCWIL